jgi:hypothetical protein
MNHGNINMNANTLLTRIEHLETNRRFIQNALEMALSLGDFQENINKGYNEVEHMIEQSYFAWAIREKRGVSILSRDHTRKFILHVIATYSRIRGMWHVCRINALRKAKNSGYIAYPPVDHPVEHRQCIGEFGILFAAAQPE